MYNEEAVLPHFVARLRPALDGLGVAYEVVCVDDGSQDATSSLIDAFRTGWPELRLVRLVRNAGHQAALSAGYEKAYGRYVVTIDADLQDPPETVAEMLALATSQGLDVVYAVRGERSVDSLFKRVTAGAYYRLMRRIVGNHVPHDAGDFRLVSRRVLAALEGIPQRGRVYRLVIPSFGFPSGEVTYAREARSAGETKYPLHKMISLMFDSVAAFSAAPLRLATAAGLLGGFAGLLALLYAVNGVLSGGTVPGWASILATVGFFGGIQLICIGLLGEYVGKIFTAVQGQPTYLIGYDSAADGADPAPEQGPPAKATPAS
jgi:dolichol-phosphate mannosyltransferase